MKNVKIPDGYTQVVPYLIVPDAEGLLKFTVDVFGATEKMKVLNDNGSIMHAEVFIGNSVIMFANSSEPYPPQPAGLFIYVDNADTVYKKALEAGATSVMELTNQDYGRTSGVLDSNGNTWWITSAN